MKPVCQVLADQQDITQLIDDRLLSMSLTDKPGLESDSCELRLDDRDSVIEIPATGATLQISLGYAGSPLTLIGSYVVDEVEVSAPPQTLIIKGKPVDMRGEAKGQRSQGYESTTLSGVVDTIAQRNGWQSLCKMDVTIARLDQTNESDMHFLTRIAKQYGATATIKEGKLIVAPRGKAVSGSGQTLPALDLKEPDLRSYKLTFPGRAQSKSVSAHYHNKKNGKLEVVKFDNNGNAVNSNAADVKLRHRYPDKPTAQAAAQAHQEEKNRATCNGQLELRRGRADVCAEMRVTLSGIKAGVDDTYTIDTVEHRYDKSAWTTSLTINAGNEGKGKSKSKKGPGKIISIGPPP